MAEQERPDAPSAQIEDATVAPSAFDLEAIRSNVNDAAAVSGGLWVSYLFVLFYLMVGAGAVTHLDLFLEKPIRLPFLSLDLPLLAFFCLAPLLFLITHVYTLIHFVILAEKAKGFHQALSASDQWASSAARKEDWRQRPDNLRRRLPNNVFVQFLAGPPEIRSGPFGLTLRAISWISLAIAPILLLLLIQVQFLPYQSIAVTWLHRLAIVIDIVVLWWLWRKILTGRHLGSRRRSAPIRLEARFARTAAVFLSVSVVLLSFLIITFDGELQQDYSDRIKIFPNREDASHPLSIHEFIFQSSINAISRKRTLPFSNTLVLTNVNFADVLGIDDTDKLKRRDFLFRVRGRNFRGAVFDHAIMPKMDFFGAQLNGASFMESALDQSNFDQADMRGAKLIRAVARGTSFDGAELSRATFAGSNLAGADSSGASLNRTSLASADLSGTKFNRAKLNGADIGSSLLFAASFNCADLSYANLNNSNIEAAFFISSRMDNANFSGVNINASDFSNASFSRVVGVPSRVVKSYFGQADKWDLPENSALKAKLEQAKADENEFSENQIAVFKQNICYQDAGFGYIINSEVFKNLSGARFASLVDYILSPDCAVSASLTPRERDSLRAKRQVASPVSYRSRFIGCATPQP